MKRVPLESLNRRSFLKVAGTAAVGLPNIITSNALGANGVPAASGRIVMAGLGMGGRGQGVLGEFLNFKEIQVVAVNDVQKNNLRALRKGLMANTATPIAQRTRTIVRYWHAAISIWCSVARRITGMPR